MAEIILPPEENEETPQTPELNINKPSGNSKVITIEFEAKKTKKVSTKDTNQQLYTTDTDAWFEFKETSLEGANGTYSVVFRNRHDGSIFQRTGDVVNGVAYYKIPHQEIRHAGAWRGQIVYTLSNGDTTAREFGYDVKGHILDGKDVREIVVEDFETLMSQLRNMKDNAELELANLTQELRSINDTAEQNETDRQAFFDDLVEDIDDLQVNYQELLETGVLQTNINTKLEQLEEEYAPKLTEVTSQLAQTTEDNKLNVTFGANKKRPVITFLDDDTTKGVYTRLKPIFETRNVPLSIACITGRFDNPNHLTKNELLELYNMGWEVLGHTFTHPIANGGITEYTDYSRLEYEINDGCKQILNDMGIDVTGFVYPQGASNTDIREITRKNYTYAFARIGINDDKTMDSMQINRIAFGSYTETNPEINGNSEKNTLAYYKACVDYAITNNAWLVFMTHVTAQSHDDDLILGDLLDYIKSLNVDILNAKEGYQIHGNQLFAGDIDKSFTIIDKEGTLLSPHSTIKGDRDGVVLSDPIHKFKYPFVTVNEISNVHGATNSFPDVTGGYLYTHYNNKQFARYNYQEYVSRYRNRFIRFCLDDTGETWTPWYSVSGFKIYGSNDFSLNSPLSSFDKGVSVFYVWGASATGSPAGNGTVYHHKSGGNGIDFQLFKAVNSNDLYIRTTKSDGTYMDWELINSTTKKITVKMSEQTIPANSAIDVKLSIPEIRANTTQINGNPAWSLGSKFLYNVAVANHGEVTIKLYNFTDESATLTERDWIFTYTL